MIKSGLIANTEGGQAACTLEYVENNAENDRLSAILDNKEVMCDALKNLSTEKIQNLNVYKSFKMFLYLQLSIR